jgi:hypothetical protein
MNTAERASLTGMVVAFVIVVLGGVLENQTTCTSYVFGSCVSQTTGSAGASGVVAFGIILLLVSAFFLARERMARIRAPTASATMSPGTRPTANMFCRWCGTPIPSDSVFCPKCGKSAA